MNFMRKFQCTSTALLIIRIVLGGMFIFAGISKLANMEMTIGFFQQIGLGAAATWIVALVEVVGGGLVVFGVFTSVASVALAVIMIVAIIIVKGKMGFVASQPDIMLLGMALAVLFAGPGKYSLSRLFCKCECGVCKDGMCCGVGKCHKGDQGMTQTV